MHLTNLVLAEIDLKESRYSLVEGQVVQTYTTQSRRRMLICEIDDGTGTLQLRFFHFNASMKRSLSQQGQGFRFYGQVRLGAKGLEMMHPERCQREQLEFLKWLYRSCL